MKTAGNTVSEIVPTSERSKGGRTSLQRADGNVVAVVVSTDRHVVVVGSKICTHRIRLDAVIA